MNYDFSDYQKRLKNIVKSKGLKYSSQREDILKALYNSEEHLTPEEIYSKAKIYNKNIGLATVYRALSFLESEGLVNSISFGTDAKKYELNRGHHHDHMICLGCGKIIEFYEEELEKLQENIAKKQGFKLITHEMNLYGLCADCEKSED